MKLTFIKKSVAAVLVAGCLSAVFDANAQTSAATLDASQVISNFKFTDSEGTKQKEYSPLYTSAYSLGYRYKMESGLLLRASVGMRNAGATLVYDESNYSWNLQYADIKLGVGYAYSLNKLDVYLTASPYYAFLLKGTQRLNNEDFDIKTSGAINKMDYGVIISPGVSFNASDYITIYGEINYLMGLSNLEPKTTGQKAQNVAFAPTLGIAFTIK
jgi:hypothetical protein